MYVFNKYFLSIAKKITHEITFNNEKGYSSNINKKYYLSQLTHKPFPNIKSNNTSTKEIEKIINSLKLNKFPGYDEISTKILQINAPFISCPLNYICNTSILSGTSHTCLKYSIVKPLLKKGDKNNVTNYRPISSLTSFSKVFEKNYI